MLLHSYGRETCAANVAITLLLASKSYRQSARKVKIIPRIKSSLFQNNSPVVSYSRTRNFQCVDLSTSNYKKKTHTQTAVRTI